MRRPAITAKEYDDELLEAQAVVCAMVAVQRHRDLQARRVRAWSAILVALAVAGDLDEEDDVPAGKRPRLVYDRPDYKQSAWGRMLRADEQLREPSSREARVFRRNFRVPYAVFVELVSMVKELGWFPSRPEDITGRPSIPLELKVLAVLQILGRGNCSHDICQMSYMSEAVVSRTFRTFCRHFAEELYHEHIRLPQGADHDRVMEHYHRLGFTGAIGSTDVTRVKWDSCPFSVRGSYSGKEGYPTMAYQATVDHTGRVLGVTRGSPGAQNDRAIVKSDDTVLRVRDNPRYKSKEFSLQCQDGTLVTAKGNYLIVGNGHHKWRALMEPTKLPLTAEDTCFSERMQSVQSEAGRFFGLLKGRFRILKLPILLRTREDVDNVFFTSCILHNILHDFDGLKDLEAGVDWGGADGLHDAWVADPLKDVTSVGLEDGDGRDEPTEVEDSYQGFRDMLLESFTYRRAHHDID